MDIIKKEDHLLHIAEFNDIAKKDRKQFNCILKIQRFIDFL